MLTWLLRQKDIPSGTTKEPDNKRIRLVFLLVVNQNAVQRGDESNPAGHRGNQRPANQSSSLQPKDQISHSIDAASSNPLLDQAKA